LIAAGSSRGTIEPGAASIIAPSVSGHRHAARATVVVNPVRARAADCSAVILATTPIPLSVRPNPTPASPAAAMKRVGDHENAARPSPAV
jgi:hypothetical protein